VGPRTHLNALEKKNSILVRESNHDSSVIQPVTVTISTELSRPLIRSVNLLIFSFQYVIQRRSDLLWSNNGGDRQMNETGAVVDWYWQGQCELIGENSVPLSSNYSQIPHGLGWDWTQASPWWQFGHKSPEPCYGPISFVLIYTNCVKHNVSKVLGNLRCCATKQNRYDTKLLRLIQTFWKRGQERERNGRSPLWRRRSALDCSAI